MLLIILIAVFIIIVILFIVNYSTHLYMTDIYMRGVNKVNICNDFNTFKKEFYNYEWERDIYNKKSFFNPHDKDEKFDDFYIHSSIVIVNGVKYRFSKISYFKFCLFLIKNKTTKKNQFEIVNNTKYKRKLKLKKINNY